jgi:cell division protein FtsB
LQGNNEELTAKNNELEKVVTQLKKKNDKPVN